VTERLACVCVKRFHYPSKVLKKLKIIIYIIQKSFMLSENLESKMNIGLNDITDWPAANMVRDGLH
jgi:hypothetical protein